MRTFTLAVAVLALAACAPDLGLVAKPPPRPVLHPQGGACGADEECVTGACIEGLCCERACDLTETCLAPGARGKCTRRLPGDRCGASAECDTGFCVDGVCCRTACAGTCLSCAGGAEPGTCRLAEDNTDPRGQCGQLCTACFAGVCGPALLGTNPAKGGEAAVCPSGKACDAAGTCRSAGGGSCSADADCARGQCIQGRCLVADVERVSLWPMQDYPPQDDGSGSIGRQERGVLDLAANGAGDVAVAFSEYVESSVGVLENDVLVAMRREGDAAGWRAVRLYGSARVGHRGFLPAAVAFEGRSPLVAAYAADDNDYDLCGHVGHVPCGLFAELFAPDGQLRAVQVIDPAAKDVEWVDLALDDAGVMFAVWTAGHGLFVSHRASGAATWSKPLKMASDVYDLWYAQGDYLQWYPALVAAPAGILIGYRIAGTSRDSYRLVRVLADSDVPAVIPVPAAVFTYQGQPCTPILNFIGDRPSDRSRLGMDFAINCDPASGYGEVYVEYDASAASADRFSSHSLVRASPYEVNFSLPLVAPGRSPLFAEVQLVTAANRTNERSRLALISEEKNAGVWKERASNEVFITPDELAEIASMSAARGATEAPVLAFTVHSRNLDYGFVRPDLFVARYHE